MKKGFFSKSQLTIFITTAIVTGLMLMAVGAWGAQVIPPPTFFPLNQIPVPEPPNLFQFVKNKPLAIKLGKAFFWDMQAGSDGIQACGSCHFSAGVDKRLKNTVNPGANAGDISFQVRGPNETLVPTTDFPFHQRQAPVDFQASPVLHDSNDIVGSQGVRLTDFLDIVPGSAVDSGAAVSDPVFQVNGVNMRRVTGRNTPSNINAVFNFNNFWDGRAHFEFNGVNPFGTLDPSAGVWFNNNGTLVKKPVAIQFGSLASQATGPPLNETEMSYRGRTFPQLGRKMLSLTPLGKQIVHPDDSELGTLSRTVLLPGGQLGGSRGLKGTYTQMIKDAFQDYLWNSQQTINQATVGAPGGEPFSQMETNFSLFWGLAIQLYEATLVSDQTPFDRFLGGDQTALTPVQQDGFNTFFGVGACGGCHIGSEMTSASVTGSAFISNASHAMIEAMVVASGQQVIYDNGYNNTAVRPTTDDIGRGDNSPFINPLTGLFFPLSFSRLGELQASGTLGFNTNIFAPGSPMTLILPPQIPANFPVANNGNFKVPSLRNVELTAPYMHNGGMMDLEDVVEFYTRGGNFPIQNRDNRDILIAQIDFLQNNPTAKAALVDFMMSLTDERVRGESAPFDHPEIIIPNGDTTPGVGEFIVLPARDEFGLAAPALSVNLTPSLTSPQLVGTPINFTAASLNGVGNLEYEFSLFNGTAWSVVQSYSANNSWNWDTASATSGTSYSIQVKVRSVGSPVAFEASDAKNFTLTTATVSTVALTPNKVSPQSPTTPGGITFTATGQGGAAPLQYEFWQHNGTSWTKVQAFSTNSNWVWDTAAAAAGIYTVQVNVRSAASTAAYEAWKAEVFQIAPTAASGATLVTDKTSPQPTTTPGGVTFSATGSGGSGSYEFEFWQHDGTSWTKVQPFSTNANWIWNTAAAAAGIYTVQVNARSTGSTASYEAYKAITFSLTTASTATGATLVPNKTSPQLTSTPGGVTYIATGLGGSGSYEFEFYLHDGLSWTKVQNMSPVNTWVWNTSSGYAPGIYTVQVNVRAAGSTAAYETWQGDVFTLQ